MALKKAIFRELDAVGAARAASWPPIPRRSSIDEIASVDRAAGAVVGLHFFSPANVMRLLEIVRGKATSREVIATALASGEAVEEGRGRGGKLSGLHRQPDVLPLHVRERSSWPKTAPRRSRWTAR